MDGPTKKCPRCRKEKPLNATKFKRTRDGFSSVCLKCLDQIAQTARTKKEKGNKENPAGGTDDVIDDKGDEDEFTFHITEYSQSFGD